MNGECQKCGDYNSYWKLEDGACPQCVRIQQLEAENAKLRSEQHEGQRVYRRLLAELEEQRVINEELRNTRGDV